MPRLRLLPDGKRSPPGFRFALALSRVFCRGRNSADPAFSHSDDQPIFQDSDRIVAIFRNASKINQTSVFQAIACDSTPVTGLGSGNGTLGLSHSSKLNGPFAKIF